MSREPVLIGKRSASSSRSSVSVLLRISRGSGGLAQEGFNIDAGKRREEFQDFERRLDEVAYPNDCNTCSDSS